MVYEVFVVVFVIALLPSTALTWYFVAVFTFFHFIAIFLPFKFLAELIFTFAGTLTFVVVSLGAFVATFVFVVGLVVVVFSTFCGTKFPFSSLMYT